MHRMRLTIAPFQGGLMSGENPSGYNATNPLTLWIIQLGIIMMTAQLLCSILRKIKQPRMISDILAGILLGPSAFGRIPGFTDHIFPSASLPYLSLTAKIGLCLFLFVIGLEIDWSIVRRNVRLSVVVSLAGVLLSFSIGCGISVAIYHYLIGPSTDFKYLMMFIAYVIFDYCLPATLPYLLHAQDT
ncbi:Sodium/hydrogen exchanger family-domain-containing protein [Chiua virens]|nr:Sodium/hydrogen exchanger family-domain-containing protein [Chiua virens]